jgi:cysteine synthase
VIDRALKVPDLSSVAAMHILRQNYDISGGPSTGVNFAAALKLIATDGKRNSENNGKKI